MWLVPLTRNILKFTLPHRSQELKDTLVLALILRGFWPFRALKSYFGVEFKLAMRSPCIDKQLCCIYIALFPLYHAYLNLWSLGGWDLVVTKVPPHPQQTGAGWGSERGAILRIQELLVIHKVQTYKISLRELTSTTPLGLSATKKLPKTQDDPKLAEHQKSSKMMVVDLNRLTSRIFSQQQP